MLAPPLGSWSPLLEEILDPPPRTSRIFSQNHENHIVNFLALLCVFIYCFLVVKLIGDKRDLL